MCCPSYFRAILPLALAGSLAALTPACSPAHLGLGGDDDPGGECGDGAIGGTEGCDDGNTESGDGCSADCQPEIPPNCGDGVVQADEGEDCDDGNTEGGDGCGRGCWIEGCGNGFLDDGEACEDGNTEDGDGCSADCTSDESCGNGILDVAAGEVCDDGNDDDTDGCPGSCQPAFCGDGFVRNGVESCDDGNDTPNDGCTDCILDSCGNNMLDDGEECDEGAANGDDGTECFRNCLTTEFTSEESFRSTFEPEAVNNFVNPQWLDLFDVNGDGRLDAVATSTDSTRLAVAYGKGDGRLAPARFVSAASSSDGSALVDFDGDGQDDIIMVSDSGDTVEILHGTPTGFVELPSASTRIDVAGDGPFDVAGAELTGDGKLDLVTCNTTTNDVTLLEGDGAGGFTAIDTFGVQSGNGGVSPRVIRVGDVTGDGKLDIVTANLSSSDIAVLAGLGGGAFAAPEIHTTVAGATGTSPTDMVLADVTNDGKLDVLTVNQSSSDVTVLAQKDDGSLAGPRAFPTFDGDEGTSPRGLAVADLDQDGVPDLVTANTGSDVSILLGEGAGVAFGNPTVIDVSIDGDTPQPDHVAVTDLDGDKVPDILVTCRSTNDVRVLRGKGKAEFEAPAAYAVNRGPSAVSPDEIHITDVDGDGSRDVVITSSSDTVILEGDGDGRLLPALETTGGGFVGSAADLDGNGTLDVASTRPDNGLVPIALQGINGRFTATQLSTGLSETNSVVLGDFDKKNGPDAVAVASSSMRVFTNDGGGTLSPANPSSVSLLSTARGMAVGDLTGDGDLDVVVTTPSRDEIGIMVGDGNLGFTNPSALSTEVSNGGRSPVFVALGDLDGEQGLDIVTANQSSNDVSVFRSTGSGTFDDAKTVPAVGGAGAATVNMVRTGDVNGDGLLDLVTANFARNTVSVIIGFGNGNFAAPQTFDVPDGPTAIGVGDLDGDGLDDIVVATTVTNELVVLRSKGHP